ncbi:MAG: tRNA pseudouridine(55) synthase TruB [Flavobacteriia bacterium]|jgi:tRNA pseudouridine55 synthase
MNFQEGVTILVDKPLGWTSFDVVNKIRWNLKQVLKVKNIKVGHAGTLDPLASGLLIICVGKHTKRIDELMVGTKTYTGTILLGKTTPSFDLETAFNEEYPTEHITSEQLDKARQKFIGVIEQVPPIFSAKQIDGKRAYDLARAGKEIVLKANTVEISEFSISNERFPEIDFTITCSKGTYIRSVANDFGKAVSSGGTLIALRRTASGGLTVENARTVDDWISIIRNIDEQTP